MSGTSKKSQGTTERKVRHQGENNDMCDVQVLTTGDFASDEVINPVALS